MNDPKATAHVTGGDFGSTVTSLQEPLILVLNNALRRGQTVAVERNWGDLKGYSRATREDRFRIRIRDRSMQSYDPFVDDVLYEELRKLASHRMAHEKPGQTLDATALVHEAYVKLYQQTQPSRWKNEAHFFSAAAEAMRRILIDNVRRKSARKHGGDLKRVELADENLVAPQELELLSLNEAIELLEEHDNRKASVVKLRYFAGLTTTQIASALEIAESTVDADWAYAKAWLRVRME